MFESGVSNVYLYALLYFDKYKYDSTRFLLIIGAELLGMGFELLMEKYIFSIDDYDTEEEIDEENIIENKNKDLI